MAVFFGYLIFSRQLHKDILQCGLVAVDGADGPAVLAGEVGDAFSAIGAGIDINREFSPFVTRVFLDDFFDVIESADGGGGSFGVRVEFDGDFSSGSHVGDQFSGGAGGFNFPFVDDDDVVTGHFHLMQDVGGDHDGVVFSELLDQVTDRADLVGVQAIGGFVEDEEVGFVHQGIGQSHTLTVSFGEGFDHFPANVGEAAEIHGFADVTTGIVAA